MNDWVQTFSWIFLAINIGRLFAYVPQIRSAIQCHHGARAISRMTWSYFALSHLTVSIYGFAVIHDGMLGAIFLGNFMGCVVLVGIVTWKRRGSMPGAVETPPRLSLDVPTQASLPACEAGTALL